MNDPQTQSTPIRVLIVTDSWQGHTARVAKRVQEGVLSEGGCQRCEVRMRRPVPTCRQLMR